MYPTTRQEDGSTYYPLSGRVIGGGSSVNQMAVVWPTQHDLDTWDGLGNPGWSYEDCLPILMRIESDQDYGDYPNHGKDGPLTVQRRSSLEDTMTAPVKAFVDRATALGYPSNPDRNIPNPFGICVGAANVKAGQRQSTAVAYLGPARERPNLRVIGDAHVTALSFDGSRVTGLTYEQNGTVHAASSDAVVLSAGVYHSPQILMLSGVGPAADLEKLGIKVVQDLHGVGGNYQDHAGINMVFEGKSDFQSDWLVAGFQLVYKSDPSLPNGDFHIYMRAPVGIEGLTPLMPIAANLLEQRSRGRVYLKSADPHALPTIDDGLLQHADDIAAMSRAMEFIQEFVDDPAMAPFYGPLLQPAEDDNWIAYARSTYNSYHHGVGTCMMGPALNPSSVVDHRLRLHGVDNLYVADASIMPTVTHANTNFTSIMIGERASDFVRADTK
jgi:choline dehydrogenase